MVTKFISELNTAEIKRELSKRGIETGGSKADMSLILEEYIRTKENVDPRSVKFEAVDLLSGPLPENTKTKKTDTTECDSDKEDQNILFMEQILDRLEGLEEIVDKQQLTISTLNEKVERLESELAVEKQRSTELRQLMHSTPTVTGENRSCPEKNEFCPEENELRPVKIPGGGTGSRWASLSNRLSGESTRSRKITGVFGNQSGVSGDLSGASGGLFGECRREDDQSRLSGQRRVHFEDSLLIPQNELIMARASIPEFAGKKEEDPVRFLLQAEAILEETGISRSRWVTVLAPQLKAQAGTWWGTMRALDLPWKEFCAEFQEKFNGDELQSSLQSELLTTVQTRNETLGEFVLSKYQLSRRLTLGLSEEAVVMAVIGNMRDEFRIHARIQRLKSFSELRALAHVLDGNKAVVPGKPEAPEKVRGFSAAGQQRSKWWDKKQPGNPEKLPDPKSSQSGCRVCGSPDHWQRNCPKKGSGNAKTTGGTTGSCPVKK